MFLRVLVFAATILISCAAQNEMVSVMRDDGSIVWPKLIVWPDNKQMRCLVVRNRGAPDTLANFLHVQFQQSNDAMVQAFIDLRAGFDYFIDGDTLTLNAPRLKRFNAIVGGKYVYLWRFRLRLENYAGDAMSGWIYSKKIQLIRMKAASG